jgi:hypothetical protein
MIGGLTAEKKLRWSFFNAERTAVSPPGREGGDGRFGRQIDPADQFEPRTRSTFGAGPGERRWQNLTSHYPSERNRLTTSETGVKDQIP